MQESKVKKHWVWTSPLQLRRQKLTESPFPVWLLLQVRIAEQQRVKTVKFL